VIREQAAPRILHACEVFDRLYHFTIPPATAHLVSLVPREMQIGPDMRGFPTNPAEI